MCCSSVSFHLFVVDWFNPVCFAAFGLIQHVRYHVDSVCVCVCYLRWFSTCADHLDSVCVTLVDSVCVLPCLLNVCVTRSIQCVCVIMVDSVSVCYHGWFSVWADLWLIQSVCCTPVWITVCTVHCFDSVCVLLPCLIQSAWCFFGWIHCALLFLIWIWRVVYPLFDTAFVKSPD